MILLKKKKTALWVTLSIIAVVLVGGVAGLYFMSDGTFNPVTAVNRVTQMVLPTESPTEKPTEKSTQKPTEKPSPKISAKLEHKKVDIAKGEKSSVKAEVKNAVKGETYTIRYATSNDKIAQIDNSGKITPLSKGVCTISVYISEIENSQKELQLEIEDSRLVQIGTLSNYLFSINPRQSYVYSNNKNGNAKLTGCKIADFDNDKDYELFVKYNITDSFQKMEVVDILNGTATSYKTEKSYSDMTGNGYTSYIENVYINPDKEIFIIAEGVKNGATAIEKNTAVYKLEYGTLSEVDDYYSKEPYSLSDMAKKAEYKINGKKKTRDEYTAEYSQMKTSKELFDDYASIVSQLSEGNYVKAIMPAELGNAYYDRIIWTSSDESVANVSASGVITGGPVAGNCSITGVIEGIDFTICQHTITTSDVSDDYDFYVQGIKDKQIVGKAGNKMNLYGYYVYDIDGDGSTDLLLYYTGGNGCQLEFAHYAGLEMSRKVIRSATTENGSSCYFEFYTDSIDSSIVMYVGITKSEGSTITNTFHYETFNGSTFENKSSEYKIVTNKSNENEYFIGGEKVEETSFNNILSRYKKLGEWILVK